MKILFNIMSLLLLLNGEILSEESITSSFDDETLELLITNTEGGVKGLPIESETLDVKCYSGTSLPSGNKIEYRVFPELSIITVRSLVANVDDVAPWVTINTEEKFSISKEEASGYFILPDKIKIIILGVGSGLFKTDFLSAKLTCSENPSFKMRVLKISSSDFNLFHNLKVIVPNEGLSSDYMYLKGDLWRNFD